MECRKFMEQELKVPLYKSVGKKGKTVAIEANTMKEYVEGVATDAVWVQGTPDTPAGPQLITVHHRTPLHTTAHHLTLNTPPSSDKNSAPCQNRTPPHTTAHHHTPPHNHTPRLSHTTLHYRAPPHTFTGYHWTHAVATMFDCSVCVIINNNKSAYYFGDKDKRCIHLYKNDAATHYDALVPPAPHVNKEGEAEQFTSAKESSSSGSSSSDCEETQAAIMGSKAVVRTAIVKPLSRGNPRMKVIRESSSSNSSSSDCISETPGCAAAQKRGMWCMVVYGGVC